MIRFLLAAFALGLPSVASAADYGYPPALRSLSAETTPPLVPVAPPPYFEVEREPQPIIMLPALWSEIRKSGSLQEAVDRLRLRFGSGQLVFRGTTGRLAIPIRVTVGAIYQRDEDALIALPAVTLDLFIDLEGRAPSKRTVTIPLYPQTSSIYR